MARYTTDIEVDAPPAAVFAYLEDFTNAARWDPGVASAERLDDVTVTPTATGSRVGWDATFRFTGVLGRLVDPLFAIVFRRIAGNAVAGLRDALGALAPEDA